MSWEQVCSEVFHPGTVRAQFGTVRGRSVPKCARYDRYYLDPLIGVSSSHVTRSSAVRLGSSWPGWLGTAGDRWGPLGTAGDRWGSLGTAGDAGDESFVTEFTYGKFIN